jgi:hypothetical protein
MSTVTKFAQRYKILSSLLLLAFGIVAFVAWDLSARVRGQLAAHFDIARGHYRILLYGMPPPWRAEYVRFLRDSYQVDAHAVTFCIVSESLMAYVDGYDSVSTEAVDRRFERDVFRESEAVAKKAWELQHPSPMVAPGR